MKLFVQADDFGMTAGVTDGIVACGRNGILTQTGLFTNMPSSAYAVRRYQAEIPHVLLGQDLNLSTGRPLSDPKDIPTLVNEDGSFLTSRQHRQIESEHPDHIRYEDAYREYEAQIQKFFELVGEKPGYLCGHAFFNDTTEKAVHDIAVKYGCREALSLIPLNSKHVRRIGSWTAPKMKADKSYDYSILVQLEQDPLTYWENGFREELEEYARTDALVMLHTHAGFLDRDLYKLSSYTAVRLMEAGLLCSDEMKTFVKDHNVELVNYSWFDHHSF